MKVFKHLAFVFALASAISITGCATQQSADVAKNSGKATCYVCKYNNDLACVHFTADKDTPKTEYNGQTYCFCSDGCRAAFLKKPQKYLPKQ